MRRRCNNEGAKKYTHRKEGATHVRGAYYCTIVYM